MTVGLSIAILPIFVAQFRSARYFIWLGGLNEVISLVAGPFSFAI